MFSSFFHGAGAYGVAKATPQTIKPSEANRHQTIKHLYTLSGRIGKVVASHDGVARSIPTEVALIYTMHKALRGYYR